MRETIAGFVHLIQRKLTENFCVNMGEGCWLQLGESSSVYLGRLNNSGVPFSYSYTILQSVPKELLLCYL